MRRLLALLAIATLPAAALAFDPTPRRGDRIGILAMEHRDGEDPYRGGIADTVRGAIRKELRAHGFDAFDARVTFDELIDSGSTDADYYVELVSSEASALPYGGIGIGRRHLGVGMSIFVSDVAASMRVYDGRSLEVIDAFDLRRRNTTIAPTEVGVSGGNFDISIALPFIEYARIRSTARAVAREAAAMIAGIAEDEPSQP
jgi:hypothetical protein